MVQDLRDQRVVAQLPRQGQGFGQGSLRVRAPATLAQCAAVRPQHLRQRRIPLGDRPEQLQRLRLGIDRGSESPLVSEYLPEVVQLESGSTLVADLAPELQGFQVLPLCGFVRAGSDRDLRQIVQGIGDVRRHIESLANRDGLLQIRLRLIVAAQRQVDVSHVVQGGGFVQRIPHLALNLQRVLELRERLVVLPPRGIERPEVVE